MSEEKNMLKPELVIDAKSVLGEGAIWDFEKKLLYWVDIVSKKLFIYDPASGINHSIDAGQMIGAVVPRKKGGLLVALQEGLYFLDEKTGEKDFIINPEADIKGNRSNDGKCDPAGRFWYGTVSENCDIPDAGNLYVLDRGLKIEKKLDKLTISNGIVWSPDNKLMFFIDTVTKTVWSFDFELETGKISGKKTAVNVLEGDGFPDGMTFDAEGMLWVAHFGGHKVIRYDPIKNKKLEEILLPVSNVTSCAFGGANLDELYITTARHGLNAEELKNEPLAGGVFKVKTKVKGMNCFKFSN
jgi:sugar lactone lactonase YvrE